MVHSVHGALEEMMAKYQQCFKKAEHVEKAFGMANTDFVNGVRQHELSQASFRGLGVRSERELEGLLVGLRESTVAAQNQWNDLVFLLPGSDHDVMKVSNWCMSHGVDAGVMSFVVGNGMFIYTDFGLTRDSFWTENERVIAVTQGPTIKLLDAGSVGGLWVDELMQYASDRAASGDSAGELEAYRQADELGDAEAAIFLGNALRRSGDVDRARAAFKRAEDRGHREAAMSLGNLLPHRRQRGRESGLPSLDRIGQYDRGAQLGPDAGRRRRDRPSTGLPAPGRRQRVPGWVLGHWENPRAATRLGRCR